MKPGLHLIVQIFIFTHIVCALTHVSSIPRIKDFRKICGNVLIFLHTTCNVNAASDSSASKIIKGADVDLSTRVKIIRTTNNLLASPVLETFRKIDQLDPDENLSSNQNNKALLYVPIIEVSNKLHDCEKAINTKKFNDALSILQEKTFDPPVFKKIFNRYSDNIFYADTAKANIYLAGGALPDSRQTQQYLLRNDILTGVQNTREDIREILVNNIGAITEDLDQAVEDALSDLQAAITSLDEYVSLSDPEDVALARKILISNKTSK